MEKETVKKDMFLNMGPSHPAMHGIIRIMLELEGETVVNADVEIGYLHRAFEKSCENVSYNGVIPYTDRLNYVSPAINNFGYCMAVEKLLGVEIPERAKYIRTIISEISRIADHLTCVGASAMELGAFTAFLYFMQAREFMYELLDDVSGARVTVSYGRIGGVKADFPEGFQEKAEKYFKETEKLLGEIEGLLTKNRIFYDRLRGVGVISQEDAISYGIMGPFLRSTGIQHDLRKAEPYFVYDRVDFFVPYGEYGDNYDRYLVRMEEMRQSIKICRQCFEQMEPGEVKSEIPQEFISSYEMVEKAKRGETEGLPLKEAELSPNLKGQEGFRKVNISVNDKRVSVPPKSRTYCTIEGLINHFKLNMSNYGIRPPKGESYAAIEGANGELGFYVVSDGSGRPYRVRVHPPCFPIMAAFPEIIVGDMVADIIATFGSVNMIGGELDR